MLFSWWKGKQNVDHYTSVKGYDITLKRHIKMEKSTTTGYMLCCFTNHNIQSTHKYG